MSFSADVSKWAIKAGKSIEEIRKGIIFDLFSSVVLDSPVLTGRLRGNWVISNGAPNTGTFVVTETTEGRESKPGSRRPSGPVSTRTVHKIKNHVNKLKPEDGTVFLANNLPYAYHIEFDGKSHTKAPEGMVMKNFLRVSSNLN
jgi:hypothetical protein